MAITQLPTTQVIDVDGVLLEGVAGLPPVEAGLHTAPPQADVEAGQSREHTDAILPSPPHIVGRSERLVRAQRWVHTAVDFTDQNRPFPQQPAVQRLTHGLKATLRLGHGPGSLGAASTRLLLPADERVTLLPDPVRTTCQVRCYPIQSGPLAVWSPCRLCPPPKVQKSSASYRDETLG